MESGNKYFCVAGSTEEKSKKMAVQSLREETRFNDSMYIILFFYLLNV